MKEYALRRKQTRCPVCSFHEGLILYSVDSEQAAQHFVLKEVQPDRHQMLRSHIESLWGQPSCDVVRCVDCDFCFADPFVAGDGEFYDLAYQRSGYPKWKWEYQRTLEALVDLNQRGRLEQVRLLEIGAGNGAFIRGVTPKLISKKNVLCTEYSEFGRNAIVEYGVQCVDRDVRELAADESGGAFDIICMFQVLEHFDRIDELFAQLSSLASESAHLFIAVPNSRWIEFNELHGSLLDMPPNHVGSWNRKSFEKIAHRHEWNVADYDVQHEGRKNKSRLYAFHRYGRKSQDSRTLANRIERVTPKILRRPLQAFAVGWYALTALPTFYSLLSD